MKTRLEIAAPLECSLRLLPSMRCATQESTRSGSGALKNFCFNEIQTFEPPLPEPVEGGSLKKRNKNYLFDFSK